MNRKEQLRPNLQYGAFLLVTINRIEYSVVIFEYLCVFRQLKSAFSFQFRFRFGDTVNFSMESMDLMSVVICNLLCWLCQLLLVHNQLHIYAVQLLKQLSISQYQCRYVRANLTYYSALSFRQMLHCSIKYALTREMQSILGADYIMNVNIAVWCQITMYTDVLLSCTQLITAELIICKQSQDERKNLDLIYNMVHSYLWAINRIGILRDFEYLHVEQN
ncbi:Hypothetical_protein [Hexamita inflata]|uniref:Hypothetical_protein n=1 Tax=Hexamita inflata TaxID=28002 RepID=A0AA86VLB9_9EUKA|nr:Hypothetical protein HINF_LOCUS57633 [Hexamita inflata]